MRERTHEHLLEDFQHLQVHGYTSRQYMHVHNRTDAVSAGGASGGDGEGGALELEGSGEHSRGSGAHGPSHPEGTRACRHT